MTDSGDILTPDLASWWRASHEQVIEDARIVEWPDLPAGIEKVTCSILGRRMHADLAAHTERNETAEWMSALAVRVGAAARAVVAAGAAENWQPLWALQRGLVLINPGRISASHRDYPYPGPHETALAEATQTAELLAAHDISCGWPVPRPLPASKPLVARNFHGSRFLITAPFGYWDGESDHWYAWDIDACGYTTTVSAAVFGTPEEALSEWTAAVGPTAAASALSPCPSALAGSLLMRCLDEDALMCVPDPEDSEFLVREHYRARRRAQALVRARMADHPDGHPGSSLPYAPATRDAFLRWHLERTGSPSASIDESVYAIFDYWGSATAPDDQSFYAVSPHRIDKVFEGLACGSPGVAERSMQLLPDWAQWCAERGGLPRSATQAGLARARDLATRAAETDPATMAAMVSQPPAARVRE